MPQPADAGATAAAASAADGDTRDMGAASPPFAAAPAGTRSRGEKAWVVAWALALGLVFLLRLGAAPLFDVDEGAFSEATREMLASGDFGHTTLNGAPRFDKPILVYWLQAASVAAFGLDEMALRLPSALCAWAWCLAVAAFAWPRWGRASALAAATVLGTSLGVLVIGRAATADALLNLLLALAGLDLWRHLESSSRRPLRRAAAWIGLGLLAKGPVALVVPGAAVLLWVVFSGAWRPLRRALADPWAWLILIAIALPWYAYALQRHGMAFVDGFLMRHNVERYTGTLQNHGGSLLYYVVMLPLLWLPWSPLLAAVVLRWRGLWREPLTRYLLGWASFVIVFFSFSGTKLPHYVLYGATPLALLMGVQLGGAGVGLRRALLAVAALFMALAAGAPWLLQHQSARIRDPFYRALIAGAPRGDTVLWIGVAASVAIVLGWRWWRPRGGAGPSAIPSAFTLKLGATALVSALLVNAVAGPWWGEALQGPVQRLGRIAATLPGNIVQWGVNLPSFAVYRGHATPARTAGPGDTALVRLDRLPQGVAVERLAEERGLALVRRLLPP